MILIVITTVITIKIIKTITWGIFSNLKQIILISRQSEYINKNIDHFDSNYCSSSKQLILILIPYSNYNPF